MKKTAKKLFTLLMAISLVIVAFPAIESKAATSGYVTPTVTFRITGDTMYLEGTGEVPDYIGADYFSRPWNGQTFNKLNIAPTITRIGQYAFANIPDLLWVDIWSETFIANSTTFAYAPANCIYRVHGDSPAYEVLGNITYSSWESIAAAGSVGIGSIFLLDNSTAASKFRTMRYPYYSYVYGVDDPDNPWFTRQTYFSEGVFNNVCHLEDENSGATLSFAKEPASESFMRNMGEFTKLYKFNYLASYKSYFFESGKEAKTPSAKTRRFILNLDKDWQIYGVTFKLLQICPDGTLFIYDDLDTNIKTFTFASFYPAGTYILVYQ